MARLPRLAVAGHAHHVLQRGHNDRPVFLDDDDRQAFVGVLRSAAVAERVAVHAYTLLDNEVQLLVSPAATEGLSRLMQALARRHGARFNQRHRHVGTLWAGRFRASVVDPDGWVVRCMRFIETARLRAGLPDAAPRWSSAPHHLGLLHDPLVTEHPAYWSLGNTPFDREAVWGRLLEQALTADEAHRIVSAVRSGWPLGGEEFRSVLTKHVTRRLMPRAAGRPGRTHADDLSPYS